MNYLKIILKKIILKKIILKKIILFILNFLILKTLRTIKTNYYFLEKQIIKNLEILKLVLNYSFEKKSYSRQTSFKKYNDEILNNVVKNDKFVLILENTIGNSEPRFLRQCNLLYDIGLTPVLLGQNNFFKNPIKNPNYDFLRIPYHPLDMDSKLISKLHYLFLILNSILSRLNIKNITFTNFVYFTDIFNLKQAIALDHYISKADINFKFIISHDYNYLPIANRISNQLKIPVINDIHEYALEQYTDKFHYLVNYYFIKDLQSYYFPKINFFTIVNESIKEKLLDLYPFMKQKCSVLRNVPCLEQHTNIYTGKHLSLINRLNPNSIKIIYSGNITKNRGLEELLLASKFLNKNIELFFVGNLCSDSDSIIKLMNEVINKGANVTLLEAVPFKDIISFNKHFDIGYIAQYLNSSQKKLALGNKFFEYIHGGLALCVDQSYEYKKITSNINNAWTIENIKDIKNIYQVLNSIHKEELNLFKKRSLEAAKFYTWKNESLELRNYINKNFIKI